MWQRLTPLEQKEFEEVVRTGRIGHLITVHAPWWEVSLIVLMYVFFVFFPSGPTIN